MGKVLNMFARAAPEPEPPPEPVFDFTDEHFHLIGHCEDIIAATGPTQVKELVNRLQKEVEGWPDG